MTDKYYIGADGDYMANIPYSEYLSDADDISKYKNVYNIKTYGAKTDASHTINTNAINIAISDCSNNGGGIVLVEGGHYICGTIDIKSNVTLYIDKNAKLISINHNRDGDLTDGFIRAINAENITITGGGSICGSGAHFWNMPLKPPLFESIEISDVRTLRSYYRERIRFFKGRQDTYHTGADISGRVRLIHLMDCKNIKVSNIRLYESAFWTLTLNCCEDAILQDIVIDNNVHGANADGIDIVGSSNILIKHCYIVTADDGIVIKNPIHTNRTMRNVSISDCKVMSLTNCFKIGTETVHNIEDIAVSDCDFFLSTLSPAAYCGITITSVDGAIVKNINVDNIRINRCSSALFIKLGSRNAARIRGFKTGGIENIKISNIVAEDVELPCAITGVRYNKQAYYVKNITLENIKITYRESRAKILLRKNIPEYAKIYPEINNMKDLPCYGLWVRHTDTINVKNFIANKRLSETRPFTNLINNIDDTININYKE